MHFKIRHTAKQTISEEAVDSYIQKEIPKKDLSTEFLSRSVITITKIVDQFVDNDADYERSSNVKRGVLSMLSCYQKLLTELHQRKRQATLSDYVFMKPKEMR